MGIILMVKHIISKCTIQLFLMLIVSRRLSVLLGAGPSKLQLLPVFSIREMQILRSIRHTTLDFPLDFLVAKQVQQINISWEAVSTLVFQQLQEHLGCQLRDGE